MKRFMTLYVGAPDAFEKWNALDETVRKDRETRGMQAWGDWMEKHKAVIIDSGGPLGKTKRTDSKGVSDSRNTIGGYIIVEAETHDDAAKLFEKHPHFAILPGDAVEIMPCNAMPTM